MKIIIVDDEPLARSRLLAMITELDAGEVVGEADNGADALRLMEQAAPDIVLLDIRMPGMDGIEVARHLAATLRPPAVIFTTAFNQYAVEAFKLNSIDYLLKPITFDDLSGAMQKLESMRDSLREAGGNPDFENLAKALDQIQNNKSYKTRFMVKLGEHIRSITADQISLFYAEGRNVFLLTVQGGKFIIDYKLEELENLLSPSGFFRVNRTFIINIKSISDVLVYSNSRLKISIDQDYDKEIIVSREKVGQFKTWFDGQS